MFRRNWSLMVAALVLLAMALVWTGCSKGPTDDALAQSVKASFYSDPQVKNEPIQVAIANGEVTLSGEVSSDVARLQAYKVASETAGVKKVVDEMDVKGQPKRPHPAKAPAAAPAAGTAQAPESKAAAVQTPPEPQFKEVTIPEGTDVRVQMIDSVDSKTGKVGSLYKASLDSPLVSGDQVVIPKGVDVYVQLVTAKAAGKIKGSSELELALDHLAYQGKELPLQSSSYEAVGASRGKQTATRAAVGTGIGAAIGAIAGGGKGAAIGAAVGGGGAMTYQLLTHGKEVKVPSETKLDFKLAAPIKMSIPVK